MTEQLKQAAQQALESIKDLQGYRPDIDSAIAALERALTASQPAQAGADEVFLPRRLAATHKLTQLGYRYDHMQGQWLPTQPAAQATPDVPETDFGNMATQQAAGEPVLYVSQKQAESIRTTKREWYTPEGTHGRYLPVRAEPSGLFTMPLYAAHPAPGVPEAWDEGYKQGVEDERTSEANIGVAGFGAKVAPARQNPYRAAQAKGGET